MILYQNGKADYPRLPFDFKAEAILAIFL